MNLDSMMYYNNSRSSSSYSGPPIRILVVDDEPQICNLLARFLTEEGYFVNVAFNGDDALKLFSSTPFDIIITDMNMPYVDGLELIKKIKSMHHNVDIIAITGFAQTYQYTEVIEAGAADFLYKPFQLEELRAKLKRILRDREERTKLAEMLFKDALTEAYNRYALEKIVSRELGRAIRLKYSLFLFFLDVDNFKEFNDTYGHVAGDVFLRKFVNAIKRVIREGLDFLFRYGGDEFILLVTNGSERLANEMANRIISRFLEIEPRPPSVSIGILLIDCKKDIKEIPPIEELTSIADKAMYEAKERNLPFIIKTL